MQSLGSVRRTNPSSQADNLERTNNGDSDVMGLCSLSGAQNLSRDSKAMAKNWKPLGSVK